VPKERCKRGQHGRRFRAHSPDPGYGLFIFQGKNYKKNEKNSKKIICCKKIKR
jgi:hypothetical protein